MLFIRTKSTKSTKHKQATLARMFFIRIKSIKPQKVQKAQNLKQATFLLLDVFIAHKNAVFFVLYTKKHKKHIKSTKTHIGEQVTFFALDVF